MGRFTDIYPGGTQGELEMFDRVIFKGYLSGLYPARKQFDWYLHSQKVLLKEFTEYRERTTQELKENLMRKAVEAGCEITYVAGKTGKNGESKEEMARQNSRLYRVTLFGRRAMSAALRLRFVDFPLNFSLAS
jgi:hypothetical protein